MQKSNRSKWLRLRAVGTLAVSLIALASACSSVHKNLKSIVGNKPSDSEQPGVKYSEASNLPKDTNRSYRRVTRSKLEEEAELRDSSGSLWVMEGQGAYLFAQNKIRMVGDLLNVQLEGGPRQQLQTKVRVISKLLDRIDNPRMQNFAPADPNATSTQVRGPAGTNAQPGQSQEPKTNSPGDNQEKGPNPNDPISTLAAVPTRIVEMLKDGSYRVKGSQPFMIGRREYKVIITGIVRPEDFNEDGTPASKLLDSQFDVVSSRGRSTQ